MDNLRTNIQLKSMIPTGLHDNVIYQSGRFTKLFSDQMTETFRKNGYEITNEQFGILTVLWYKDGISQKEIANSIERDKTTISRVLDSMIKRNLLTRESSSSDGRSKLIFLTEKGKQLQHKLVTLGGEMYLQAIHGISEEDLNRTLATLQTLIKNMKE